MDVEHKQSFVTFWQARAAQALLIFIGITTILPVIWRIVATLLSGIIYPAEFSVSAILSYGVYIPALITGIILALVIALRSATWGEITWRFMLSAAFAVSFIIDFFVWAFKIGTENFFISILSWLVAGAVGYGLLCLCALDRRYCAAERPLFPKALLTVITYGIYIPALYTLLKLAIIYDGDRVAYLVGRQEFIGTMEPASFLMAVIIVVGFVVNLRRGQWHSKHFWVVWPLGVIIFFLFLHFLTSGFAGFFAWLRFYFLFTVLCVGFSTLLLALFEDRIPNVLKAWPQLADRRKFTILVFSVLAIAAVVLWQCFTIIWLSFVFGLPSITFFFSQLHIAILSGVIFFALPCAFYAWVKQCINFTVIFIVALCASVICSFLPSGHLGVPLGFVFDHLFWQMLTFGPTAVISWYILSRMPQIKCS